MVTKERTTDMRITAVEFSGHPKDGFLTYVAIELDAVFVIKNMKIVKRKHDGAYILVMPTRSKPDGTYTDIAHPLTSQFRRQIEDKVFEEYRKKNDIPQQANATTATNPG